jgi:hypothetical protein
VDHILKQSGWLATLSILLTVAAPGSNAADKDPIADYQADLSAGPVSANEILGLTASAVTTIESPKDFVVAIGALSSNGNKAGFGLAFTPARTRFAPVSIADYQTNPFLRAWAGTTFSYAQNTNTQGGVDYTQEAYALHLAYYLHEKDDPAIAGHKGFEECTALVKLAGDTADRLLAIRKQLRAEGVSDEDLNELARQRLKKEEDFGSKATPVYKACVDDAITRAKAKWNASQLALTAGKGTIHDPATGSSRLSLGTIYSFAMALGPTTNNLLNVTVRRNLDALELSTIATTPTYKDSTLAGARWTYRAIDTQDLYAVAEVSNAKASSTTTSNVFKYAVGVDKRLTEGVWIELRVGRNHTQDGNSEQTTALMNLKLSPKSSLAP